MSDLKNNGAHTGSNSANESDQKMCKKSNWWIAPLFKPTATAHAVLDGERWGAFFKIMFFYVIISCIVLVADLHIKAVGLDTTTTLTMSAIACVLTLIFSFIIVFLHAWFIKITGKWLGGRGQYRDVCTALALGLIVPLWLKIVELIITAILFIQGINLTLKSDIAMYGVVKLVLMLIGIIFFVWMVIVMSKILKVAQDYESAWRGFANYLLGTLFIVIIIVIIAAIAVPGVAHYRQLIG